MDHPRLANGDVPKGSHPRLWTLAVAARTRVRRVSLSKALSRKRSFTGQPNPGMHPMNWLRPNRRAFRPTNVLTPNRRARRVAARRQEEGARSGVPGLPTFKRPVALDAGTHSLAALS